MSEGYQGTRDPYSDVSEFAAISFLVSQIIGRVRTATIVKVKSVTNSGGLSAVGYVDVTPLVSQIDGDGVGYQHAVIHNVPYFRVQGGTDAIILDPKVGDLGIAVFADRDITSVKANKDASLPGSKRRHDMADAMYIGGLLNGIPAQYVQFTSTGINVVSPSKITCQAPNIEMDASTSFTVNSAAINLNGNTAVTGTLKNNGKDVGSTHEHTLVQPGTGVSGPPQ